MYNGHEILNNV